MRPRYYLRSIVSDHTSKIFTLFNYFFLRDNNNTMMKINQLRKIKQGKRANVVAFPSYIHHVRIETILYTVTRRELIYPHFSLKCQ